MQISEKRSGETEGASGTFLPTIPLPQNTAPGPMAISDMANVFGVTHRTLHFYEEKGLIKADRIGAMRVYPPEQVRIMALVNVCRETGMPIAQIQDLLGDLKGASSQSEADRMFRTMLMERKRELTAHQSIIRRQMQQITDMMNYGQDRHEDNDNADRDIPALTEIELKCLSLMRKVTRPSASRRHSI